MGTQVLMEDPKFGVRSVDATQVSVFDNQGKIRINYGAFGIRNLAVKDFCDRDGTPWGSECKQAIENYAKASMAVMLQPGPAPQPVVVENLNTPQPVRVTNFPESAPSGGVATMVGVLNFPETQHIQGPVQITNYPETQKVAGDVNVGNFPDTFLMAGTVDIGNLPDVQPVSGSVEVSNLPDVQLVSIENLPDVQKVEITNPTETQKVSGTVAVSNLPDKQTVQGEVNVGNLPAVQKVEVTNPAASIQVSNLPQIQPVSGTVDANIKGGNTTPVKTDGSGYTQPVSGQVAVTNLPQTQDVRVMNLPATQPISGTVNIGNLPATQPVSGSVTVANPVTSVSVSNLPATQPISGSVTVANPVTTVAISNFPASDYVAPADTWQYSNASLGALSAVVIAPAVSGKRHYITGIQIYNLATLVLGTVEILDGTTVIARIQVPAAGGKELVFPTPLRGSINSAISVKPATAAVALMVSCQGYVLSI